MKKSIKKEKIGTMWGFDRSVNALHNGTMKEGEKMVQETQEMQSTINSGFDTLTYETGKLLNQSEKGNEQHQQFISTVKIEQEQRRGEEQERVADNEQSIQNEQQRSNIPRPTPPS